MWWLAPGKEKCPPGMGALGSLSQGLRPWAKEKSPSGMQGQSEGLRPWAKEKSPSGMQGQREGLRPLG